MALAHTPESEGTTTAAAPVLAAVEPTPEAPAFDELLRALDDDGRLVHVEQMPATPERVLRALGKLGDGQ